MAIQTLDPIERLRQKQQSQFFESDTTSGAIASEYSNLQKRQADMLAAIQRAVEAERPQEDTTGEIDFQGRKYTYDDMSSMPAEQSARIIESAQQQGSILPGWARVTQAFGNVNPRVEVFNKSGVNTGTDFGIKEGTPLALPPGEWEVLEAYSGAKGRGFIGNKANRGYGNSVLVKNSQTGETMRFSHLSGVNVQPGKIYKGGTVLGASGATGNVTGPHLDLEYKTAAGKYQDVLRSQYAKSLFGQGGGSESYGMGGGVSNMLSDIKSKAEKAISDYVARNKEMANRYGEMEAANYNMASAPILPNVKWQEIAALMEKNNVPGRTIVSAFGEMQAKDPFWNIQQKMRTGQPISDQERKILNESAMMTVGGSTGSLAGSVKDAALVKKVINNEKQITSIINRASDQKLMSDPIAGGQNIEDAEKAWKAIFGKQKMPLSFDETVGRLNEALEGAKTQTLMQREATRIPDIDLNTKVGVEDPLIQEARKYKSAEEFASKQISKETGFKDAHQMSPGRGDFSINDVFSGKSNQPKDILTTAGLKKYGGDSFYGKETIDAINNARKTGKITIYRAVPKDVKNIGDSEWVYFSKNQADAHGMNRLGGDYKVISKEVNAKDVFWDGNDIREWGYDSGSGNVRKTKPDRLEELRNIWKQANGDVKPVGIDEQIANLKQEARYLEQNSEWDKLSKVQSQLTDIYNQATQKVKK